MVSDSTNFVRGYKAWCNAYDDSAPLSARAIFALWYMLQMGGKLNTQMFFPSQDANMVPFEETDPIVLELVPYYCSAQNIHAGCMEMSLSDDGQQFIRDHQDLLYRLNAIMKDEFGEEPTASGEGGLNERC